MDHVGRPRIPEREPQPRRIRSRRGILLPGALLFLAAAISLSGAAGPSPPAMGAEGAAEPDQAAPGAAHRPAGSSPAMPPGHTEAVPVRARPPGIVPPGKSVAEADSVQFADPSPPPGASLYRGRPAAFRSGLRYTLISSRSGMIEVTAWAEGPQGRRKVAMIGVPALRGADRRGSVHFPLVVDRDADRIVIVARLLRSDGTPTAAEDRIVIPVVAPPGASGAGARR